MIRAFNIYLILVYQCPVTIQCIISAAQTDISLRYKTFHLKINKLPTFSEITQVWQYMYLKLMFIWSDEPHTEFQFQPEI